MINTKRPSTDNYTQVGFIEAKDNQGNYQNIDHIYDSNGNIIFQQGYLNEYQGADDFGIPAIGKPLIDYTIWGNTKQDGTPTPDNPIEPEFCGDLVSIELDEPLRAVGDYKDTLDLGSGTLTRYIKELMLTGEENWNYRESFNIKHLRFQFTNSGLYRDALYIATDRPYTNSGSNYYRIGWGGDNYFYLMNVSGEEELTAFKSYLAQQYAYGTPVKVWYVLAEPIVTTLSSIPDGLTRVIEGTVTQSGTPTPDNPIEPVFNGKLLPNGKYQVYTTYKIPISSGGVNLFNGIEAIHGRYLTWKGDMSPQSNFSISEYIPVRSGYDITLSSSASLGGVAAMCQYDINKNFIVGASYGGASKRVFHLDENCNYIRISYKPEELDNIILNYGSTPLPYEPYVAPTVNNIYLGQVQTTRRIKKLVLTGEENWEYNNRYTFLINNNRLSHRPLQDTVIDYKIISNSYTPYASKALGAIYDRMENIVAICSGTPTSMYGLCVNNISIGSIADFKSYLAQQYAAGTPVTVWYVLAEPEVGIVNEPLCRIGDYADSITFEQAGIEIPTLKKPNTTVIDVETEVEPSEVDVTYRGLTKPKYDLFLAQNGDSFEAKDGQSLYIGGNP